MTAYDSLDPPVADFGRLAPGERRNQIIAAATTLFWERGYHGASMRDIGDRVGMLKGSLYAHVSNKEEILLEIVSNTFRRLMSAVEPVVAANYGAVDTCKYALRAHVTTIAEDPGSAYVFFHEARHLAGQPGIWVADARSRYLSVWVRILQAGVDSGEFRADLDVETAALMAMSAGEYFEELSSGQAMGPGHVADRITATLLKGCLPR